MEATTTACDDVRADLPAYVFEELPVSGEAVVREHLHACAACREQEGNLRLLIRAVRRRDRAKLRAARQRRRLRGLALAATATVLLAGVFYWLDKRRQAEYQRHADLALELRLLTKQVATLAAEADEPAAAVEAAAATDAAANRETAAVPTPPAPPTAPEGGEPVLSAAQETAALVSGIRLLDIGDASHEPETAPILAAEHPLAGEQLPYKYEELRSLILAGIQPEAARVDPAVLIDQFGPRYRSDVETPLVLAMHAAPSPFERESLVVSVGVGHQPVTAAVETNKDYTFVLAEGGAGTMQRTLRKALLPWLFDKLDGSCRVTVVAAGAETETLLENEPVRMTPEGQPAFAKVPAANSPRLYELLREQRDRLEKIGGDRRQHVMVLIPEDASLPGPEHAPWPEQLGDFAAPWLDFTVVQLGDGASVSRPELPYLAELARQGEGRLISIGTDVLGWEERLLPRVASLSSAALHAVGAEVHFNPNLVAAFRPLHNHGGWAQTTIGAADRWPKVSRLGDGASRTGVYLVTPQQGGEPDRVVECRVKYDAGDAKFAAEERIGLQPEQISNDFFTAPAALQVPVVAAAVSDVLTAPESPDRQKRIAALRQVWSRLSPSLAADGVDHAELGDLIAALW